MLARPLRSGGDNSHQRSVHAKHRQLDPMDGDLFDPGICRLVRLSRNRSLRIEWRSSPVRALKADGLPREVDSVENKPTEPKQQKPVVVVERRSHPLLGLIIVIVIALGGIGIYHQWFTVTAHDRQDDQKRLASDVGMSDVV